MALKDLKTNLKSLRYGSDKQGGGNSNEPYIQTDINAAGNGLTISSINPAIIVHYSLLNKLDYNYQILN